MQSHVHANTHANITEAQHPTETTDGTSNDPCFVAHKYPNGTITISVEGFSEAVDGETLFTFNSHIGVEVGRPTVLALFGDPSIILFKGTFAEHRQFFRDQWDTLAQENERLGIFDDEGLLALAQLDKLPMPPLPEIDEDATARVNKPFPQSRRLVEQAVAEGRKLTLADCIAMVEAEAEAQSLAEAQQPADTERAITEAVDAELAEYPAD